MEKNGTNFHHVAGTELKEGVVTSSNTEPLKINLSPEQKAQLARGENVTIRTSENDVPVVDNHATVAEIKETIDKMVNDPAVRANALTAAQELLEVFRGNWFTVDQVQKKTGFKEYATAHDFLNVLCFLELCYREEKLKGVIKYKITLSIEDKIALLREELLLSHEKSDYLGNQIETLTKKLASKV